jgi:hypothetical protein
MQGLRLFKACGTYSYHCALDSSINDQSRYVAQTETKYELLKHTVTLYDMHNGGEEPTVRRLIHEETNRLLVCDAV